MMLTEKIGRVHVAVQRRHPLVHDITNYVVMNSTANGQLAVGPSPANVHAVEEVEEFVTSADAENAITAGADGIAVVIAIASARDPEAAARQLTSAISSVRQGYRS
jgi:hydroxyethylthiazole kinase-like sugar kinase family protein